MGSLRVGPTVTLVDEIGLEVDKNVETEHGIVFSSKSARSDFVEC